MGEEDGGGVGMGRKMGEGKNRGGLGGRGWGLGTSIHSINRHVTSSAAFALHASITHLAP